MNENSVVITEKDGKYQITNHGISEFALLGILECIVYEMKTVARRELTSGEESVGEESAKESVPEATAATATPIAPQTGSPELRTRISNAVKTIKELGGDVPEFDAENATNDELQEELRALTEQYKRLKNSQVTKK